ncbi:TPA: hypothetical protein N0F65_009509 [Lagenidium giganteum]|uniref:Uncharacterized protein n=1 Tax=Lagenidium giganteum TaxID=4803 RepID=A0AAV2ZHB1_9STRA|nr:TPA: hypothetical protein N0F65_009509 [Lagenidium giganteum]
MHHGGADKNWRGKYLRALNICQPEVDFPRDKFGDGAGRKPKSRSDVDVGSRSYGSSSEKHDHLASWSRRDGSVQKRSTPRAAARGATAGVGFRTGAPGMNSYGFTLKPALSRGRRCHTDPFTMEEHVSAPIQIPSAHTNGENPASKVHRADNRMFADRRPDRRREGSGDAAANDHTTRLLSWEEPVAMLAAANAVAAGLPDEMKELPASFVPPHQMVERDCFSLGLQNEFKRRPVRI